MKTKIKYYYIYTVVLKLFVLVHVNHVRDFNHV